MSSEQAEKPEKPGTSLAVKLQKCWMAILSLIFQDGQKNKLTATETKVLHNLGWLAEGLEKLGHIEVGVLPSFQHLEGLFPSFKAPIPRATKTKAKQSSDKGKGSKTGKDVKNSKDTKPKRKGKNTKTKEAGTAKKNRRPKPEERRIRKAKKDFHQG